MATPSAPATDDTLPTTGPPSPRHRLRRRAIVLAAVVAAVLLAWQAFASFGFDPLMRWALPRAVADRGGAQLTLAAARLDPWRLAVRLEGVALREPGGAALLDLAALDLDLEASSVVHRAVVLQSLRLTQPVVTVDRATTGEINWLRALKAMAGPPDPDADPDAPPPRVWLRRIDVVDGVVAWTDLTVPEGFRSRAEALELSLVDLSTLPEHRGSHTMSAAFGNGATLRWKGGFGLRPLTATGELALDGLSLAALWPYLRTTLDIAEPGGTLGASLSYRVADAGDHVDLHLEGVQAEVAGLALQGASAAEPAIVLDRLAMAGATLDLATRALSVDEVVVDGGRVRAALDEAGRLDLWAWLRPSEGTGATPPAGAPWQFVAKRVGVDGVALAVEDRGFKTPWRVAAGPLALGFGAQGRLGGDVPDVVLEGLRLGLKDVTLSQDDASSPWFTLPSVALDDGRLSLADRALTLGTLALDGGHMALTRDEKGRLTLLEALQRHPPAGDAAPDDPGASPWRLHLAAVTAQGFSVEAEDRSLSPTVRVRLTDIEARVQDVGHDLSQALPVSLRLASAAGGTVQAEGRVVPGTPSADLRVTIAGLALSPAAPYVAQFSTARLAGGSLDARARVRAGRGPWRVDGGVTVNRLGFDEAASGDRLLGWRRLAAPAIVATPRGTRIDEVTVDGLVAKIVVSKTRQLNLAQVVKPPTAEPAPAAKPSSSPRYDVQVARVKVVDGGVDFADLSLALPFGTRVHALNGAIVSLRSGAGELAEVALEGQVDAYGLARVNGRIQPFDPAAFTDLAVVFRNVEMATLTPYSATFAGRRIASGRLSLDLQYKINDRQMTGDNRIVMDQLVLGERVESPDAVDLPLDLAVAILQDAEGRIDLGLPVSGSLDDPQVSIGGIVWKAVVNLLTRIVTAPFRALGALFGGSDTPLDRILFDPGASALLPPEREKLDKLAGALAQRPGLALKVQGGLDTTADGTALRELGLRRAVAGLTGRPPAEGEAPSPLGLSDPVVGQALQTLFVQRFGAEALAALRPSAPAGAASAPASAAPAVAPSVLRDKLLAAQPLDDAALPALARQRAERIREALLDKGVPAARVALGEPVAQTGERGGVPSTLAMDAAAPGAALPAPAASAAQSAR